VLICPLMHRLNLSGRAGKFPSSTFTASVEDVFIGA